MRRTTIGLGLILLTGGLASGCPARRTAAQRPARRPAQRPAERPRPSATDALILGHRVPEPRTYTTPVPVARPSGKTAAGLLDISWLLGTKDILRLLGSRGPYQVGRLPLPKRSSTVDTLHFKAKGKGEVHDLAFRVWKHQGPALDKRFDSIRKSLPKSRLRTAVGDRALSARSATATGYAYLDRKAGVVVLLSCGVRLCVTDALLLKVATHLHQRMTRGAPGPARASGPAAAVSLSMPCVTSDQVLGWTRDGRGVVINTHCAQANHSDTSLYDVRTGKSRGLCHLRQRAMRDACSTACPRAARRLPRVKRLRIVQSKRHIKGWRIRLQTRPGKVAFWLHRAGRKLLLGTYTGDVASSTYRWKLLRVRWEPRRRAVLLVVRESKRVAGKRRFQHETLWLALAVPARSARTGGR